MSVNDRTMSGIPIDAVYGPPPDGTAPPPPGEYPYTRGLHPEMYRTRRWTMRMFAGFGVAGGHQRPLPPPARRGADAVCRPPSTCRR